jgi:endonuclease-3
MPRKSSGQIPVPRVAMTTVTPKATQARGAAAKAGASRSAKVAAQAMVPSAAETTATPPEPAPKAARAKPKAPHGTAEQPRRARRMGAEQAAAFIRALAVANPAPETELRYADPFTLLVAVVLSAQTTDAAVNRCTPALFAAAPGPVAMAALGEDGIARHIRSIGLWQAKARNVAALARQLVERHGGAVPAEREALEALPGVGRKTANVVLNVAFGQDTMAVDTHIFRIGNRTGLAPGKTPREVEDGLVARCPPELLRDAHHWLILHGRYVCKARLPECWRCVARAHCN